MIQSHEQWDRDDHRLALFTGAEGDRYTLRALPMCDLFMMTSSNGNIIQVTGLSGGGGGGGGGGGIHSRKLVTRSFDVFFDLRLNKRLSKQSRRR